MTIEVRNLFALPRAPAEEELFEPLLPDRGVLVERIISNGQSTPAGDWLEQDRDEWVALLQGRASLSFADGQRFDLSAGDHLLIAAGVRHRVEATSRRPACIWLAVHGQLR